MCRKLKAEKKAFEETVLAEKEAWVSNNQRQYNAKLSMAETQIRNECIRERDKQIELAIVRLEKESDTKKSSFHQSFENQIR